MALTRSQKTFWKIRFAQWKDPIGKLTQPWGNYPTKEIAQSQRPNSSHKMSFES